MICPVFRIEVSSQMRISTRVLKDILSSLKPITGSVVTAVKVDANTVHMATILELEKSETSKTTNEFRFQEFFLCIV